MPMRLRGAVAGAVALLLCLSPCAPAAASAPAAPPAPVTSGAAAPGDRYAALDAYVRDRMEETRVPGLSYAVVGPDGPLHRRSWGTDGRGSRVTPRTPFLWGSVAKPVTATAVMTLVQDGRLRLEDRVTDHVPGFRFGGPAHASRVTVRHLLTQTAGIPASATAEVTDCLDAGCPGPADRIRALDGIEPLGPPGTRYAYSSANYVALAAVVESVTGRPFTDHLRRSVLEPAGMDGAIVDRASARDRKLAPGHQLMWGIPAAVADGVDDHGASYGYLGGDLDDLSAFAAFQLRSGRTADGRAVLTPASVRLMRQQGTLPGGEGTGYGLGWRVGGLSAPLDTAVWHTGGSPGYSAMLFLLPERNVALVLQQNLYGLLQDDAIMDVGFQAARMLAGAPAPEGGPSAAGYHLTIWGVTALGLLLVAGAVRSAWLLRRPAVAGRRPRRVLLQVVWCLLGAAPGAVLLVVAGRTGLDPVRIWLPDVHLAGWAATAAGALVVLLRLTLVLRSVRAGRAERAVRAGADGAPAVGSRADGTAARGAAGGPPGEAPDGAAGGPPDQAGSRATTTRR
ncbi:serine hydrolase domain-containing protein [Streptomyces pactum]|uniref:serine hydrolase domain-containing protein n=1 Tax=Streptomyces pactum TaxID=68249 RepID=UPI0036F7C848